MKTISAGGNKYNLHTLTGTITQIEKERVFAGYRDGTITVGKSGLIYRIHDRILLMDDSGMEHAIELIDFDINSRPGHKITFEWAIKTGKDWGPYVRVKVHDTGSFYYHNPTLFKMFAPPSLPGILALGLIFMICFFSAGLLMSLAACFVSFLVINFFIYNQIIDSEIRKFKRLALA